MIKAAAPMLYIAFRAVAILICSLNATSSAHAASQDSSNNIMPIIQSIAEIALSKIHNQSNNVNSTYSTVQNVTGFNRLHNNQNRAKSNILRDLTMLIPGLSNDKTDSQEWDSVITQILNISKRENLESNSEIMQALAYQYKVKLTFDDNFYTKQAFNKLPYRDAMAFIISALYDATSGTYHLYNGIGYDKQVADQTVVLRNRYIMYDVDEVRDNDQLNDIVFRYFITPGRELFIYDPEYNVEFINKIQNENIFAARPE